MGLAAHGLFQSLFEYTAFQKWSISREAKLLLAGLGFFALEHHSTT